MNALMMGGKPAQTKCEDIDFPAYPYIQAFHWQAMIADAASDTLTAETDSTGKVGTGWKVANAHDHWPTLHWATNKPVPLISKNTKILLGTLLETEIQNRMGIVFGQLPCGWNVSLSGARSESYILDRNNAKVGAETDAAGKIFVFVNVEPGVHMLYFKDANGLEFNVATPVLDGTSTYIETAKPSKQTFTGNVFDASGSNMPIAHAEVSVLGQPEAKAFSDAQGRFSIGNVVTMGDYPLYVQTEAASGYTHRYRVLPALLKDRDLYRMTERQIDELTSQLAGGVSPQSGLIVAAVPGIVSAQSETQLFAGSYSLMPDPTLPVETYSVAPTGQLEVNTPLSTERPRFVSVQLPSGPVVTQIEDKSQRVIWSELVPTSAGVVNLVGPY